MGLRRDGRCIGVDGKSCRIITDESDVFPVGSAFGGLASREENRCSGVGSAEMRCVTVEVITRSTYLDCEKSCLVNIEEC